jgi:uncharacterized membrane protein YdjX (TVP38/TMEM64 family)
MKTIVFLALVIATAITIVFFYQLRQIDLFSLRSLIASTGFLAPLIYIILYCISTIFLMPSTPLNLMGGILFGAIWGTLWTSVAALIIAFICFAMTREFAQAWVSQRLAHYLGEPLAEQWRSLNTEIQEGGIAYLFALRLLPILPYGLVNFGAGLTAISYRDYIIGTALGTVPGIFPFVWLGSLGLHALSTGEILPVLFPLALIGLLVGGSTWYQRRKTKHKLE